MRSVNVSSSNKTDSNCRSFLYITIAFQRSYQRENLLSLITQGNIGGGYFARVNYLGELLDFDDEQRKEYVKKTINTENKNNEKKSN